MKIKVHVQGHWSSYPSTLYGRGKRERHHSDELAWEFQHAVASGQRRVGRPAQATGNPGSDPFDSLDTVAVTEQSAQPPPWIE